MNPYWGYSESPLIVGDRILVNAGGSRASIVAISKADGSTLWQQHNDGAGYSSPMLMRTGSLNQVIFFTDSRTLAVDPRDGRLLWSYNKANNGTANVATPIVRGTRVFVSSDYGTGGALLEVRAAGNIATANEIYFTRDMRNHHASSVLVGDHLYGFSSSILTALAFDTGKPAWRDRSVGKGSLIFADGRLYLYSEDGVVGLAEASPTGYREHGRFTIPQQSGQPTWSHPMIAGGLLIIRDQDTVYAYDVRIRSGTRRGAGTRMLGRTSRAVPELRPSSCARGIAVAPISVGGIIGADHAARMPCPRCGHATPRERKPLYHVRGVVRGTRPCSPAHRRTRRACLRAPSRRERSGPLPGDPLDNPSPRPPPIARAARPVRGRHVRPALPHPEAARRRRHGRRLPGVGRGAQLRGGASR